MNDDLLAWLAECRDDPLAFVLGAFPWGEPGPLEAYSGPSAWQVQILSDIRDGLLTSVEAILIARASGHGIGKSALVAWIVLWAMTTFPDTRGVVTANTETQLKTKTWAELGKWFNMFIGNESFVLTATALMSKDPTRERTWRIDQVTWSDKNTEAFAGLHNKGKRILLVMDEASAIPDIIWETAEGALTDANTQIMWLAFGNPTRNSGRFRECFDSGRFAKYWNAAKIDSRSVGGSITNTKQIERWIDTYGIDSDFVRIRVLGEFPRTGEMEFISAADVDAAMSREVTSALYDPLALGCDVARYGANESVIAYRKGRDARTIPWQFFRGLNTVELATKILESHHALAPDGIFIDGGGIGGGVVDNVRHARLHCYDVQFGGKDDVSGSVWGNDGERYANKRAAMWGAMRHWIRTGALPFDPELKAQLIGPTYSIKPNGDILLESKEDMMSRGVESPDRADALALTFAYPIAKNLNAGGIHAKDRQATAKHEYDPYSEERMAG